MGRDRRLRDILNLMELASKEHPDQQAGGTGPAGFPQAVHARASDGDQRDFVSSGRATLELQDEKSVRMRFMVSWKEKLLLVSHLLDL